MVQDRRRCKILSEEQLKIMKKNNDFFNIVLLDSFFNTIAKGDVLLEKSYGYFTNIKITTSINNFALEKPLYIIDTYKDAPIKNKIILNDIQHLFIELFAKSKTISVTEAELLISYINYE